MNLQCVRRAKCEHESEKYIYALIFKHLYFRSDEIQLLILYTHDEIVFNVKKNKMNLRRKEKS